MSLIQSKLGVEYPESDGVPMGETDLHRDWMVRILELMRHRYRGRRVYIASDLLVYFEEGEPTKFVVPDDFVVLDCEPGRRRVFKIWEEGRVPNTVFEVTSRGTRREDAVHKPAKFARIGVAEYFLYDPSGEYLDPSLQGFRLQVDEYVPIRPDAEGVLDCQQLGITLRLKDNDLLMHDMTSGIQLLTEAEAAEAHRLVAEQERTAAVERAQQAESRAAQLEEELQKLRDQLRQKR